MSDIEVVLGAKNEASAVLQQFRQEVASTAQGVQFSLQSLTKLAGVAIAVQGVVEAARSVFTFIGESSKVFDEANRHVTRLAETLDIIGAGNAKDNLQATAKELERLTNIDDKKILNVMNAAMRRGVGADAVDDAARAAIGLSRVFDRDLGTAMQMVESAINGNFEAFKGLIPQIDAMSSSQQKLDAVVRLASQGLENQTNAANDAAELANRGQIAYDNLRESVGRLIAPLRQVVTDGMIQLRNTIEEFLPQGDAFQAWVEKVASDLRQFATATIGVFVRGVTAAEVALTRWKDSLTIVDASFSLFLVRLESQVRHSLTAVIPAYAKWFKENFLAILRDTAVAASHIVENLGNNIAIAIRKGMGEDVAFVSLLDGFETTMQKLPDIGERVISQTERALKGILDDTMSSMFQDFDSMVRVRMEAFRNRLQAAGPDQNPNLVVNPAAAAVNAVRSSIQELSAFESRVLTRGPSDTPLDRMLEIQQEMLREQREANRIAREGSKPRDEVRLVKVGGAF